LEGPQSRKGSRLAYLASMINEKPLSKDRYTSFVVVAPRSLLGYVRYEKG
jgi:hypothetical protein